MPRKVKRYQVSRSHQGKHYDFNGLRIIVGVNRQYVTPVVKPEAPHCAVHSAA